MRFFSPEIQKSARNGGAVAKGGYNALQTSNASAFRQFGVASTCCGNALWQAGAKVRVDALLTSSQIKESSIPDAPDHYVLVFNRTGDDYGVSQMLSIRGMHPSVSF